MKTLGRPAPGRSPRSDQRGVVLIIALIMLVVVSMLATLSIRNATSSESVSGNVRTTELATQSAEIGLRQCEKTLAAIHNGTGAAPAGWNTVTYATSISVTPAMPYSTTRDWDVSPASYVYVLPLSSVNAASPTFKRPPECMVQEVQTISGGKATTTVAYTITARGFGPEVSAADASRTRPDGSEIWLQSTVEFE